MAPPIEIAIPNTALSSTTKPYTIYNISLRLPLRSFIIQKRYSDFTALHDELTSQVGAPPPATLPQKSWFKRTTSSPELTEERRQGLEGYLRSINESGDTRWRNTAAWRAFLNLPSNTASANSSSAASQLHGSLVSPSMGGAPIVDPTVWLDCHRELRTQLHDARLHLTRRDQATSVQGQHESSAAAKRCLVKAGGMITALDQGLKAMGESDGSTWGVEKLGDGEMRRRKDLVGSARKERDGLEALSNSLTTRSAGNGSAAIGGLAAANQERSVLFATPNGAGGRQGGRVLGRTAPETEQTRELDNDGVLLLQRQMMAEQDQDVDQLAKVIARQKAIGLEINAALANDDDLLKLVDEDVDRVGGKLKVAKKRVNKIS
ncbi:MAG: hypothetical protein M1824_004158 [Vezdaea acicularis]|nr:MAG: hypothetical protein M1824_004158 [Vezdaea acicularis]